MKPRQIIALVLLLLIFISGVSGATMALIGYFNDLRNICLAGAIFCAFALGGVAAYISLVLFLTGE